MAYRRLYYVLFTATAIYVDKACMQRVMSLDLADDTVETLADPGSDCSEHFTYKTVTDHNFKSINSAYLLLAGQRRHIIKRARRL